MSAEYPEIDQCPHCQSDDIEYIPMFNDPDPADVYCQCRECGHGWWGVEPDGEPPTEEDES